MTVRRAAGPVEPALREYLSVTGLGQQWRMFSSPPKIDQYVRVRYYIASTDPATPGRSPWIATELVMPAHREDRIRLLQSFRDSNRDKAVAIALDNFYRRRRQALVRPDTTSAALPDDLAPVARYFAARFARANVALPERVVRTEVWVGEAPIPRRLTEDALRASAFRLAVLRGYYDGPIQSRLRVPPFPPYHAAEDEADIRWVLEYFEGA